MRRLKMEHATARASDKQYLPYLPTKEELSRELSLEYRALDEASLEGCDK